MNLPQITVTIKSSSIVARSINTPVFIDDSLIKSISLLTIENGRYVVRGEDWKLMQRSGVVKHAMFRVPKHRMLLTTSSNVLDEDEAEVYAPPMGIWRLAHHLACLVDGLDILVFDPNIGGGMKGFEGLLRRENFDLIGLSVISANMLMDVKVMGLIKEIQPEAVLIIGGIDANSYANWQGINMLPIDYIVIGAGEYTLEKHLANEVVPAKFEWGHAPTVLREDTRMAQVPFSEMYLPGGTGDVLHVKGYESNVLYFKFSNTCKEGCYWCISPKDGLWYENPLTAVDALALHVQDQHADISIVDNNISAHAKFMIDVCRLLSTGSLRTVPKHAKATISGMTDELLRALASAGFVRLAFGVESFDDLVRTQLGKRFTKQCMENVLTRTVEYGIRPEINLIFCSPYETIKSLSATLNNAARWLDQHNCLMLVALGLYCTISTKSIPSGVSILKKNIPTINADVPWIFKPGKEVEELYFEGLNVYARRLEEISSNRSGVMPNHLKSLLKLEVFAELMGLSCVDVFKSARQRQNDWNYVHI
jgi:radical SAM superfamily enzyme YgiQ (UPF0313 family)